MFWEDENDKKEIKNKNELAFIIVFGVAFFILMWIIGYFLTKI